MTHWLPKVPPRLKRRLDIFTEHRDGFARKYRGQTLFVIGRKRFLVVLNERGWVAAVEQTEKAWDAKRIDFDTDSELTAAEFRTAGGMTFQQLASLFYTFIDGCVANGSPKWMRAVTAWDYKRTLNGFGYIIGAATPINDLCPADFTKYAKAIATNAPSTRTRHVAYIEATMRWGMERGYFADNKCIRSALPGMKLLRALIGPDLVKPPAQDVRDARIEKEKAFTPAQFGKLWWIADDTEKLWLILGVSGAFDNADTMHLMRPLIIPTSSLKNAATAKSKVTGPKFVIDFRRRKRGRVRRVIPMVKEAERLLDAYRRPEPAVGVDANLFFLQADGTPLAKMTAGGPQNYLTRWFTKLMIRADLRSKPIITRKDGVKRVTSKGSGDGQNYRSLRTTFTNLAPSGFREEVELIYGHQHGTVLLDSYLEKVGLTRLYELVNAVWRSASSVRPDAAWRAAHPTAEQRAAADTESRDESPRVTRKR